MKCMLDSTGSCCRPTTHLRRDGISAFRACLVGSSAAMQHLVDRGCFRIHLKFVTPILLMQERNNLRLIVFQLTDLMEGLDLLATLSDPFDEVV